ncbi:MAG: DMT family transporter [Deltaproteobacteria bacterium]|nr:DMT family transporter [Deltaproteobacteria bacterium]
MPTGPKLGLVLACVFWAISFIATKKALEVIPPLTVVAARLSVSAACFAVYLGVRRPVLPRAGARSLLQLFVLSLFGTGLHYGLQTVGLQYTSASNASIYAVTGPITIIAIAVLFLGERLTTVKAVGVGVALGGVLTVMGLDTLLAFDLQGHLLGDALVLLSIVLWGGFTVYGKKLSATMGALPMTALTTIIGALSMLPVAALELRVTAFDLASSTAEAWVAVAFLGVTCSFLATLLYVNALAHAESQKVGAYLYAIPPMTYLAAGVYLHEPITARLLVGSLLVLGGVALTERG